MRPSSDQSGHELTDSDAAAALAASSKSGSGTRRGRRRADRPRREDEARSSPRSPPPSDVQHSPRDSLARLLVRAVSSEPITPELLDAAGRLAERIALTVSLEEALKQKHAALREAASNVYSAWIYCWTESETNGAMKVLAAALWPEKESDEDWTRVNTVRDHRPWP